MNFTKGFFENICRFCLIISVLILVSCAGQVKEKVVEEPSQVKMEAKQTELKNRFERALTHQNKGEYNEAEVIYKSLLAEDESLISPSVNLGIIADMRSNYDLALETYEKALRIYVAEGSNEEEARIYINMGITYGHQDDWRQAIQTFERGLDLIDKGQDEELKGLLYINLPKANN